ncbi:hypothetical protein F4821DRAFT_257319 [Hypoxylon rubiginosum]|uniref:Uncharacterized protein n=1 Tax=Hypoxylon rubiginosum TaxID=110542 RepID=A0ACC0D9C3_9PEZI|nr:hypothetical protein F4821DRAFT_257319 [Hypoxylon rubiginosum]
MFGGFAPPTFTKEEIEQHEAEAMFTVRSFLATAVALYIGMPTSSLCVKMLVANTGPVLAPFAVDAVSGLL